VPADATTVPGIAFLKGGEDPSILPDAEYPPWLWQLTDETVTYLEARKRYESGAELDKAELRKFFGMRRQVEIKERNVETAK
jgi:large subunit ribosomal protein L54